MERDRVHFTKEKATALITLRARALQSRSGEGILHDPWAERAIERIDCDSTQLAIPTWRERLIAARARQLDLWTADFLAAHPDATVLQLGCGLDSRVFRIDPPAGVRWFDLDYPDVIEVRRRLFPERPGYDTIAASLADTRWLAGVPRERPGFVVAEGVTQYLGEDAMRALLQAVTAHFPEGRVAFDAHSRRLVRRAARAGFTVGDTGATFGWGVDEPEEVRALAPSLRLVERIPVAELARRFRLPWRMRLAIRVTQLVPSWRALTCLLFRF